MRRPGERFGPGPGSNSGLDRNHRHHPGTRGTNRLSGYGQLHTDRTGVYCETNFGGNLYQLGPGLTEAKLLVNKLGDGWYTVPQLTPVRGERHSAWGLADRDLVRLSLP